jgi:hypothetical protein
MVETITPVVHGGKRGSRWAVLLITHVAGAAVAAAAFGSALGAIGGLLDAPWGSAGIAVVAAPAGLYLARETLGIRVPVPQLRRQVPDWWRTYFRFGPASFLYGLGLGVGFLTYLSHGTLVVVAAAAVASGRPLVGAALLAPFGLARGLTAVVAIRARTPDEGSALVGRLARSSSWTGWRVAHAAVLANVLVASLLSMIELGAWAEGGAVAAALLALAFGAAAAVKLLRPRVWRRALASYRLPAALERSGATLVPLAELSIVALAFLGRSSTAGLVSLVVLGVFSAAIVAGRLRIGTRLDCGCFGAAKERDYRLLLLRNGALAVVAAFAWRDGVDAPIGGSLGVPAGGELLPAGLVVAGIGLAIWLGVRTAVLARRGAGR